MSEFVFSVSFGGYNFTGKIIERGEDTFIEPISGNEKHVHFHVFTNSSTGRRNVLIRDQNNKNIAAFERMGSHGWRERGLTDAEEQY